MGDNAITTPAVHGEMDRMGSRNDASMAGWSISSLLSAFLLLILIKKLHYVIPHQEMD